MKGSLPIDVATVDIDLVISQERNHLVDVVLVYCFEKQVVTDFFDSAYHFKF